MFAVLMAAVLLASSAQLSFNAHYCGGDMVKYSFSLGVEHLECGMASGEKEHCSAEEGHAKSHWQSEPCCNNQHAQLQMLDELIAQKSGTVLQTSYLSAFAHSFISSVHFPVSSRPVEHYYPPPPQSENLQVLFQTFII